MLSRHARAGLRLLAEVVAAPDFPPAEVERLRSQRLTEILRRRHQPSVIADERLAAALYQGTVYANPTLGTEETVPGLGRDQIVDFYRGHYSLSAAALVAVSDLDPEELLAEASAALAALAAPGTGAAGGAPAPQPDIRPVPLTGIQVHIVDRPGAAQTELRLGHAGVPRKNPDSIVLTFLNALLGGKFTSRINLSLRERYGLTYGASSRFAGRLGPGPFAVSAGVATESTGIAAREILSELRRIQDEPVGEDEMEETRSYMLGVFPYTVQSIGDLARRLADLALYQLPDDHFDRYLRGVASLTRADLQEAARRHLHPDRLAIVAVGPAALLRPQLEPLGELMPSTAGEPIPEAG
jgi:zinc protease